MNISRNEEEEEYSLKSFFKSQDKKQDKINKIGRDDWNKEYGDSNDILKKLRH